jgi:hypothetical protein
MNLDKEIIMYYQDKTENLHFLSDEDIARGGEKLLPQNCVQITDEQAAAIQAAIPQPAPPPPPDLLGDIASWIATQANPPQSVVDVVAMKMAVNKVKT